MLSRAALLLLSDATKIQAAHGRFFLRLICDFDLRTWRILSPIKLAAKYKLNKMVFSRYFCSIVRLGLLEVGPAYRGKPQFRIARPFLLAGENLEQWIRSVKDQKERESLTPAKFYLDYTQPGQRIQIRKMMTPLVQ